LIRLANAAPGDVDAIAALCAELDEFYGDTPQGTPADRAALVRAARHVRERRQGKGRGMGRRVGDVTASSSSPTSSAAPLTFPPSWRTRPTPGPPRPVP
jgi:hypothetical protein